MAVLKDLIVHGPSRFLNAAYYNKIDADEISTNTIALQKITAKTNNTISIVAGLVDVDGELHTKSFTNSNIATIDGSFYITPTISLQGDETNGYTAVATNNSISFSGTSYNLGSAYLDGSDSPIAWSTGSTVIVTGEVLVNNEWIPLGTLKGTLSTYSTNTNPNVVGITNILDSVNQSSKILGLIAGTGNLPYRKVKISLISVNRSGLKPLGIYMTAAGSNGRTFLDIYGGNLAESTTYGGLSTPVVRIGNLSGSNLPPVGNVTPNGWGIYTSNGFFSGTVAARQGKIGNGTAIWTIGSDGNNRSYIYSGINNITNSGTTKGIYVGTNGISNYENSTQYVNLTGGKITAQGADIQGILKADTGRIGGSSGWTIASQQISSGTLGSDNSMFLSTKNLSGTVSGKTFDSSNPAWRLTVGSNFGITNTGSLYASEAVISGAITANSLNVGSVSDPNHLIYNSSTGVIDLSTDWLKFVNDAVIIGKDNESHISIDYHSFKMIDENENTYVYISNLRGSDGRIIEEFVGDGTTASFSASVSMATQVEVTIDDIVTTSYTLDPTRRTLTFDSSPRDGAFIVFKYKPRDSENTDMLKAYTLGIRKAGAVGANSFAEGYKITADGRYSHAEGYNTVSHGQTSHAEGYYTKANGIYSHAEGSVTIANGMDSHAEGSGTIANESRSHAEGYGTVANGLQSHAEGYNCEAHGSASHVGGCGSIALSDFQTVIGKYNKATVEGSGTNEDPYRYFSVGNYAFIIGNGSGNTTAARSNALTVDWNGVTSYYGDVTNTSLQIPPNSSTISSVTYAANSGGKITEISFTKKGNIAMIRFQVTSTSAISSGSNILTAQLVSKYHPIQYTTGVGYYGGHAIVGRINASGQLIIRNASSSGVTLASSKGGVEVAFTYILKDYFV